MSSIQTFENVDGTGNASSSQIVGQADPRVSHLVGMPPPQLKNGLVDLPNPGRTDRVPFREQPSAGVDGAVAPYPRSSLRSVPAALPRGMMPRSSVSMISAIESSRVTRRSRRLKPEFRPVESSPPR